MSKESNTNHFQESHETESSIVIESPNEELSEEDIRSQWSEEDFERAIPTPYPSPKLPQASGDGPLPTSAAPAYYPYTFVPPNIGIMPYSSMCKVYYKNGGQPFVASGWIVHGNTGVKGIITSGHVVYLNNRWSNSYVVRRQYYNGTWAEEFFSNFARTLKGWINQSGLPVFWDIGAIIPSVPVPASTPSLGAVWNYNYNQSPFNFYYDTGYPAKPANGYNFNGELLWESDGPLYDTHWYGNEVALQAYNAMEQGSSGSPWLIYDAVNNIHYAAGVQATGWDGIPSSYSPYFDQRNILSLLVNIGVISS